MAKRGRIDHRCKRENGDLVVKVNSDDSDEDYEVDEDEEFDESEDEYGSSLAEDESQESLGEFEEEEEWIIKKAKKGGRPRGRKVVRGRKKTIVKSSKKQKFSNCFSAAKRKKKKAAPKEEEEVFTEDLYDDFLDKKSRMKPRFMRTEKYGHSHEENSGEKEKVSYLDEDEDFDDDDTDCEDDEEFTPSEEMESISEPVKKKSLKRKNRSTSIKRSGDRKNSTVKKRKIKGRNYGRRNSDASSDSNFEISGESDYEYTISEEEREQVREANEICGRLTNSVRDSSLLETINEVKVMPSKTKNPGRKGKQKLVVMNIEVGKQVCGICLSEEGNRTVVGVLNCCTHYFCFACIMEWSKVESRCPLCKQRFGTISRTVRSEGGHDVKDAVFPVPERDQVYQPSEEELRGYLDPYENVLCTECHQGGDDALMLLCDLCDSPAHTYCVGMGHEVPDGNWYCDGCRPVALASQAQNFSSDHGPNNVISVASSPPSTVRESFDLNEAYVPETPLSQLSGYPQASSAASGSGAFTLFERRRIQHQIRQFLNNRRESGARATGINLFGSLISRDGLLTAPSREVFPPRSRTQSSSTTGHQQIHPGNSGSSSAFPYQYIEATAPSRSFQGRVQTPF